MCLICTKEYNNITSIYCCENRQIKKIPKTLINLKVLNCDNDVLISPQT